MKTKLERFGAQSMTAPLRDVLVHTPGKPFGSAFDEPALGFDEPALGFDEPALGFDEPALGFDEPALGYHHPVDLALAKREHAAFCDLLTRLDVRVHELGTETGSPDLIYTFDPLLVTERGAIALRSGKSNRVAETAAIESWTRAAGIPTIGRIEQPGTVDGGDTFWLRPDLFCIGRSLRTNTAGARQLAEIVGGDVRTFDVPFWKGRRELVHLLSVISPVSDDLAVVFPALLPVGLWELLRESGIRLIAVPEAEYLTLGCNVLAVRPGVVVVADGNPATRRALQKAGCEVHAFAAEEIGLNGNGGPTCLTRPIYRG